MFLLFNFSSIFPGGQADPICPYVRTPDVHVIISKNNKWQMQMLKKKKKKEKTSYTDVNNYKKRNKHRGIKEFLQKLY